MTLMNPNTWMGYTLVNLSTHTTLLLNAYSWERIIPRLLPTYPMPLTKLKTGDRIIPRPSYPLSL